MKIIPPNRIVSSPPRRIGRLCGEGMLPKYPSFYAISAYRTAGICHPVSLPSIGTAFDEGWETVYYAKRTNSRSNGKHFSDY